MRSLIGRQISFISRVSRIPRLRPLVTYKTGRVKERTWNTLTVDVKGEPNVVYLPIHFYKDKLTKYDVQSEMWTFSGDE